MIKAIIFDYFGVIRPDVVRQTFEELGGDWDHDHDFVVDSLHASHYGGPHSRETLSKHLGISEEEYMAVLSKNMGGNDQNLLKFIKSLNPKYKIGLLSNIGQSKASDIFEPSELKLFDAITLSSSIGYAKPEPEAYEAAADQLAVRCDECIFTDDHEDFCEAAQSVGMSAIHYKSLAQFQRELSSRLS